MKKTFIGISFLASLLLIFSSCNVKEILTHDVEINDKVIEFDLGPTGVKQQVAKVVSSESEVNLLDSTFALNVEEKISDLGFSVNLIKSLLLTSAKLEVQVPLEFADDVNGFMQCFSNMKIYFDDKSQLVAKGSDITTSGQTGIVNINIVNGELLNKLKQDQLRIILTGSKYPEAMVHVKFITNYKVKVGLTK
ncbi:MAG: hypothetical protein QM751_04625 [Paludibacteraceae bacterium]